MTYRKTSSGPLVWKPYRSTAAACSADKDCGPLEICHKGECVWFDEIPLGTPVTPTQQAQSARPGPTFNPFLSKTYNPFPKRRKSFLRRLFSA
jgi:hypothetical protein